MNLSDKQVTFLKKEFDLEVSYIEKFDIEQWQEIREKCFDREAEGAVLANEGNDPKTQHIRE